MNSAFHADGPCSVAERTLTELTPNFLETMSSDSDSNVSLVLWFISRVKPCCHIVCLRLQISLLNYEHTFS